MNQISDNNIITKLSELIVSAANKKRIVKAVFSKPLDKSILKAIVTLRGNEKRIFLQIEYFHKDNKATHKNISIDGNTVDALCKLTQNFLQVNLICNDGECEYKRSASGKEILLGADKLEKKLNVDGDTISPIANNREKKYILDGSETFLKLLDVSDKNGRVYDRKQAKFRQINRFLELIKDVEDKLPKGDICICDLCCGKSYLSFAVYHYFANIKKYKVFMRGVDLKSDVISRCNDVAQALGFSGLQFICADITDYEPEKQPSLVISLHACDVATDLVLNKAANWNTDVILSTPCCHHELNHNINCPSLSFISDYSMLRQKLCDAATDALRLCRLEAQGYSTMALELIDPDETPKNIMLRAVRKKNFDPTSSAAQKARSRYYEAKRFLCGDGTDDQFHF